MMLIVISKKMLLITDRARSYLYSDAPLPMMTLAIVRRLPILDVVISRLPRIEVVTVIAQPNSTTETSSLQHRIYTFLSFTEKLYIKEGYAWLTLTGTPGMFDYLTLALKRLVLILFTSCRPYAKANTGKCNYILPPNQSSGWLTFIKHVYLFMQMLYKKTNRYSWVSSLTPTYNHPG